MLAPPDARPESPKKRCPDCGEVKPLEAFCRNNRSSDGRASYCRPCHNARTRASVARNGGSRKYHLHHRYGVGTKQVEAALAAQGGLCAICRVKPATQVDHNHASGQMRTMMCDGCNGGLGAFRESEALLLKAIAYLERRN